MVDVIHFSNHQELSRDILVFLLSFFSKRFLSNLFKHTLFFLIFSKQQRSRPYKKILKKEAGIWEKSFLPWRTETVVVSNIQMPNGSSHGWQSTLFLFVQASVLASNVTLSSILISKSYLLTNYLYIV